MLCVEGLHRKEKIHLLKLAKKSEVGKFSVKLIYLLFKYLSHCVPPKSLDKLFPIIWGTLCIFSSIV